VKSRLADLENQAVSELRLLTAEEIDLVAGGGHHHGSNVAQGNVHGGGLGVLGVLETLLTDLLKGSKVAVATTVQFGIAIAIGNNAVAIVSNQATTVASA